jgi:uncharacterized membrane protein YoaK (UPF0700 family)
MAEGLYEAAAPGTAPEAREKGHAQALDLGLICICFLCGAVLGAWAASRFGNHSLWLTEPLLLTAALRAISRSRLRKSSTS